jgi:hypothetical protein
MHRCPCEKYTRNETVEFINKRNLCIVPSDAHPRQSRSHSVLYKDNTLRVEEEVQMMLEKMPARNDHKGGRQHTRDSSSDKQPLKCNCVLYLSQSRFFDPQLLVKDLADKVPFAIFVNPGLKSTPRLALLMF